MITELSGTLTGVDQQAIAVASPPLVLRVLVPAVDLPHYAAATGSEVRLHTRFDLEAQGQGASYLPRLIGFRSAEDRAFFELITSVKGLGVRKALRVLERPLPQIATAIQREDVDTLTALPEIGKRTAEAMIVTLRERVEEFASDAAKPGVTTVTTAALSEAASDAVSILVQLGEPPDRARHLVERAGAVSAEGASADELVSVAFRLRDTLQGS